LLRKLPRSLATTCAFVYPVCVLALFIFQYATLQLGDRWKIHIYDHLALRILPDQPARAYFEQAGLPISGDLMRVTGMLGYEYHDYFDFAPQMEPVRVWIAAHGRTTILRYLLTHPGLAFVEPLRQFNGLVNGSNLEYRYPNHPKEPVPVVIEQLTGRFYPHDPAALWIFGILIVLCLVLEWRDPAFHSGLLWVWAALALSVYPLMVVIWNGNPLEIERHAAQLGIQVRLAGLVAGVLILDRLPPQPDQSAQPSNQTQHPA
jgi:hypothetical protein